MTKIWDRLYVGSFKDAEHLATANPCGITTVLSLCEEVVRRTKGISYLQLPVADSRPVTALRLNEIMTAIGDGVRRGKLLVHCIAGSSRSPIMIAAWLNRCGYTDIELALAEISEVRDIDPSPVLLKSVQEHLSR
jgi:atypical dual specificity phosphatase